MNCKSLSHVLRQDKANRFCADCRITLKDTNQIYASFLPLSHHIDERWTHKNWIETKYGRNFVELHESFVPSGETPATSNVETVTKALTGFITSHRNEKTSLKSIAHGVFICKTCAEVHSRLDPAVTKVKLTSDTSFWSEEEYDQMLQQGNTHGNNLLEKFMPNEWVIRKKNRFENKLEREVFIRYKYEILDFLLPKERYSYKKFMKKNQTATKKWKHLAVRVDKDVDWAVYTLGYRDYKEMKQSTTYTTLTKKKKKYKVPLQLSKEAGRYLQDARTRQLGLISSVIKIQAYYRMISTRRQVLRISAAHNFKDFLRLTVRIQSRTRSFLLSMDYNKKKKITIVIQALFRGRRVRLLYFLTRKIIIKIQSFVRGYWTRKNVKSSMYLRSTAYREQIVKLWERTNTPLTYRTKFWMHIDTPAGFAPFVAQENELIRLWNFLQFNFKDTTAQMRACRESILANRVYVRFLQVQAFLRIPDYFFPIELDTKGEGNTLLKFYAERLQLERVQIYERLLITDDVDQLYLQSGLNDAKKKKKKLAKLIWNDGEDALKSPSSKDSCKQRMTPQLSTSVFDQLFPEIRQSANINPIMPSKKSLERIGVFDNGKVPLPLPVDGTTMHLKSNLDQQIIHNLAEISRCFVTGVRHLALTGTLSSNFERLVLEDRHLYAMESSKHSLIHRFVNSSMDSPTFKCHKLEREIAE